MNHELVKAVYMERKRTYHILTAVMEAALAEPVISKKFRQFVIDTQQESEWRYFLVSDEMHEEEFEKEEMNNDYTVTDLRRRSTEHHCTEFAG